MNKLFFAILALFAMTSAVFASSHSGAIVDTVVLSPFQTIAILAYDNIMHVFDHVVLTATILVSEPASALMMLDGIGAACFSAAPPVSHMLFATGALAITTTAFAMLLMSVFMAFAVRFVLRRLYFGRHQVTTYA